MRAVVGSGISTGQAVGESRTIVDIAGKPCVHGEIRREPGVERVALVVVDGMVQGTEVASRIIGVSAGESPDNVAALFGDLVGVSNVKAAEAREFRRVQGHLPRANQCAVNSDGEVHVGFAEVGVIEEIVDSVLERIDVESETAPGNLNSDLKFFIALRGQGSEGVFAAGKTAGIVEHRRGYCLHGSGLEEASVKAAENPMETRNLDAGADAGVNGGFVDPGTVDGKALSAEQRDVAPEAKMIGDIELNQGGTGTGLRVRFRGCGAIVDDGAEQIVFGLVEGVEAAGDALGADFAVSITLTAEVV